jgi:lysyl-tRNA synthetase class II
MGLLNSFIFSAHIHHGLVRPTFVGDTPHEFSRLAAVSKHDFPITSGKTVPPTGERV